MGGGPLTENLIHKAIKAKIKIHTSYGLTEMASQVTTTASRESISKLLTAGRVLPYRRLKVEKTGEILVKGKTLFQGYWEKGRVRLPLENGWFRTGDLGQLDKNGYLTVQGRCDRMFISGGENIYPEEIEKILCSHPRIIGAVVVPVESFRFGYRPRAFIETDRHVKLTRKDILEFLQRRLPKYKIPDTYFQWPCLPGRPLAKFSCKN